MIGKDRRSRILLEELGRGTLKHHTDVEVQVAHLLRDVGSSVDGDNEVQSVLTADRVNQILIPRKPIFSRIPSVDNLIKEDPLDEIAIPMLCSLQLLKDVILGELGGIRNASIRLIIRVDRCAVLSLDVEQYLLSPSAESKLSLLLEVDFLRLPVTTVTIKNDVSEVIPELQSLSPLGELSRLSVLVVVRPVVCYWRVVPSTVLERIGLSESVFDISLLSVLLIRILNRQIL